MTSRETKKRKHYGQICPMATALDIVGDRWTLLILRELLGGPARFHALEAGLPGIAKNLLTSRLRRLEEDGVIRRVSSQTATLYVLTEQGAAIRPTLEQLAFWGAKLKRVAPPEHDRSVRAIAMALQALFARAVDALPAERVVIELDVGDEPLEIVLGPRPTVTARPSTDADARLRVSAKAMTDYLAGRPFPKKRIAHVSGDPDSRTALLRALGVT